MLIFICLTAQFVIFAAFNFQIKSVAWCLNLHSHGKESKGLRQKSCSWMT